MEGLVRRTQPRRRAKLVREAAEQAQKEDGKPRFVAGAIGPTNRTASISPDVNNPGFRAVSFRRAETRLCRAGRRPCWKAASIFCWSRRSSTRSTPRPRSTPSPSWKRRAARDCRSWCRAPSPTFRGACCRARHRKRSGIRSATPRRSSVGLNCALGAKEMRAHIAEIARVADTLTCAYPNAGLPNEFGLYDESPRIHGRAAGGIRAVRSRQHRRRLLRHHARSYARHRHAVAGTKPRADPGDRAAASGCPGSSRSRSRRKSRSSMSASAPTSPAPPSSRS